MRIRACWTVSTPSHERPRSASRLIADSATEVTVSAYGAPAPLPQLAQVSVRDPRALIVNVFDSSVASQVEKAIRASGLNLNPAMDATSGRIVVPVPKPSRETREAMQKVG